VSFGGTGTDPPPSAVMLHFKLSKTKLFNVFFSAEKCSVKK